MDIDVISILSCIITGILEIIIGIPLLYGKIKPNIWYGFRTPKTRSNDEIWYKANKYVGRDFIFAGIIFTIVSLFLLIYRSNFSIIEISWIGIVLLITIIIVILLRGFIYLNKL